MMLIDEVELILKGGHGGAGKVSFTPRVKGGPDGGNGGRGGDLYIMATSDLYALNRYSQQKEFQAGNGEAGGSNKMYGKDGSDLELLVPIGTVLVPERGFEIEFSKVDQRELICKGGKGGRGNFEFRSPTNTTPRYAQPGLNGDEKHFKVVLKMLADYGLIGLPNAGKSSLLNELTRANAKVANYAFTTLEPNLGVFKGKILADIPGLIEGASFGKGLGFEFLKHIEKVKTLLHCISAESEDVVADYKVVMGEMESYNSEIVKKQQVILLTKADLVDRKELDKKVKQLQKFKHQVLVVSIHDWDSLERLKEII